MRKNLIVSSPVKFIAEASETNPALGWMEFVLTDNQPNENKKGIKKEAFASLITTGLHLPLKMAEGAIEDGHENATPLGSIVSLKDTENSILGKASVWKKERPNDYELLVSMASSDEVPHISWELCYTESELDEFGTEWITDPNLTAATIVGLPAYGDRTPVTSVASASVDEEVIEDDEEVVIEDNDELIIEDATEEDGDDNSELLAELDELRTFKKEREELDARVELSSRRMAELAEAGIELSDEQLDNNRETWLNMNDTAFTMVVSLLKETATSNAVSSITVPDVTGNQQNTLEVLRAGFAELKDNK